jgi:transposase
MKTCGMDVHLRTTTAEVIDSATGVVDRTTFPTTRGALERWLRSTGPMRVVLEASTVSHWVADLVEALGHEVVVVDPTRTSAVAVAGGFKKTDGLDAGTLAWLASRDAIIPSHRPSPAMRERRRALKMRSRLLRSRGDLARTVRSFVVGQGFRPRLSRNSPFGPRIRELEGYDATEVAPMLSVIEVMDEHLKELDARLLQTAGEDVVVRRLMTVDGVGPVTASLFRVVVGDPHRFRSARQVAAYVGLVPAVYQSGATQRMGRITGRGDVMLRCSLVEAAHALMNRCRKSSNLRAWALQLKAGVGAKKAAVAVARKLCSIMWSMWMKETDFRRV